MGEKKNAYRILVRKPEGKRPLGRLRHRWVDNIKTDLRRRGSGSIRVPIIFFSKNGTFPFSPKKIHLIKSDWGTLVPRINVENGIKVGFLLE
jgi:hypothetical protein